MTRELLRLLVDVLPRQWAARALIFAGIVIALPLAGLFDIAARLRRRRSESRMLAMQETRCPVGHLLVVVGDFACEACGTPYHGSGFAPCPACGEVAHRLMCPCGRAVLSPTWPGEDR